MLMLHPLTTKIQHNHLSNEHYFVLLGVEHVVALLAEPDPNKSRTFIGRLGHSIVQITLQTNNRSLCS